jgi:hypothetical protein
VAVGVGDGLDIHAVAAVLGAVVGAAAADAVAFGERSVQEDEVGIVLAQRFEKAWGAVGEQAGDRGDAGVGGADGYPEAGRDAGEGVVPAQVHQRDQRTLVRREFAPPVPLTGDDEHRDPLDQGVRKVECGRIRDQ